MQAHAVLLGDCTRTSGATAPAPCGGAVVNVLVQDGFMSFQFHSPDRVAEGRYREIYDFGGPNMTAKGADKTVRTMPVTELHYFDGAANQLSSKSFADMQCELKFADAKDIKPAGVRKIVCSFRDGAATTAFALDNVRLGDEKDLKDK